MMYYLKNNEEKFPQYLQEVQITGSSNPDHAPDATLTTTNNFVPENIAFFHNYDSAKALAAFIAAEFEEEFTVESLWAEVDVT